MGEHIERQEIHGWHHKESMLCFPRIRNRRARWGGSSWTGAVKPVTLINNMNRWGMTDS